MGLGLNVGLLGVLILSHAAYSTIQYRGLLKITEDEFTGPPINMSYFLFWLPWYCLMHLVFHCSRIRLTGVSTSTDIRKFDYDCRIVSLPENLDFMIFNHRGRVALSDSDMKLKK
uniref:Membrane magnesium transporter n=1 Tax=Chenopodium quinoa TaxID=63459 RepID=A0A803M597_CHEQI